MYNLLVIVLFSFLAGSVFWVKPTFAMVGSVTQYPEGPGHLGAFYIKDTAGKLTVYCSGSLISSNAVISSCYCLNQALQQVQSKQGAFYGGELRYAQGQTSMEPAEFNAQKDQGMVYDTKIDYSNIQCPPGVDLSDTTNFPNDIAIVSIPKVNIAALGLLTAFLAIDEEPLPGCIQPGVETYIKGWSSSCSCNMNVNISRNYMEAIVLECEQTQIFSDKNDCDKNVFCTKQDDVLLTLGDSGGANIIKHPGLTRTQFGVISYQFKTKPYGTGCTLSNRAQVNTRLKPFGAWIRKLVPGAKYVPLSYAGQ